MQSSRFRWWSTAFRRGLSKILLIPALVAATVVGMAVGDSSSTKSRVKLAADNGVVAAENARSASVAPGGVAKADGSSPSAADLQRAGAANAGPRLGPARPGAAAIADATVPGRAVDPGNQPEAPGDLSIFRNTAVPTSGVTSVVNEPSTDQSGKNIMQTGNWHAEYSHNSGTSWTTLNPFTLFGSGFCCDQATVYDAARDRQYWILQFGDHETIANSDGDDLANWCFYNFTPASFGLSNVNNSLDYNDLAIGTNFLYWTVNAFGPGGGTILARLPLDSMQSCSSLGFQFINRTDLFTLKVAQGTSDVAYAASTNLNVNTGTNLRILRWAENSNTITTSNHAIPAFIYMSPGTVNEGNCASNSAVVNNWCQRTDSRILGAARGNNLWFSWNARQTTGRPFPYTRFTQLQETAGAPTVVSSGDLFGNTVAHMYASPAPDNAGHIGYVDSFGGGTTSNFFPGGLIGIIDDVAPSVPGSVNFFFSGSGGGCLNGDGFRRWGDYNTARGWSTGDGLWTATTFARNNNNNVACNTSQAMTVRNVAFGRERSRPAYKRWKLA